MVASALGWRERENASIRRTGSRRVITPSFGGFFARETGEEYLRSAACAPWLVVLGGQLDVLLFSP
jgi:hypothetical protein